MSTNPNRSEAPMATKAERAHAESEKTGGAAKRGRKKSGAKKAAHAQSKATYAREGRDAKGRASRKSTRASSNRAKPDAAMNIREELVMASPASRARHDRAKRAKRAPGRG
jgi:hypothetical protein